jgi:predicted O-methyltransferase YrrM
MDEKTNQSSEDKVLGVRGSPILEYQYTKDWFNWAPQVWSQLVPHLPGRKDFLEIGSFEGRSAVWTIENMMEDGGEIYCIDTWEGGAEHTLEDMAGTEERFQHNITLTRKKFSNRAVVSLRSTSVEALAGLIAHKKQFDFIYIDGSHLAKDVLTDACMSWPLLKPKGFIVFDDYMWRPQGFETMQRPKIAIDTFVNMFENELSIAHVGYQLIVRKV